MPAAAFDFIRQLNVDRIVADFQDKRQAPATLVFLNRLNQVPASNRQLLARYQGRVQIADMIATNAKAPVYKAQKFRMESNTLGKIKIGTEWTEDEMEELLDLAQSPAQDPDGLLAKNMIRKAVLDQVLGIEQRMEWLAVAMALDGAYSSSTYNRLGFSMSGATWGMPSDLKVTLATPWTNPSAATPIDDILAMIRLRRERYGRETNRITLPLDALRAATRTVEFTTKVNNQMPANFNYANTSQFDDAYRKEVFGRLCNCEVVLYDSRYWSEGDDGTRTSYRFLPLSPQCPVILDDKANDRDDSVADFGVGTPMESRMSELLPNEGTGGTIVGSLPAGVNRIVSYPVVDPRLDPPGLTIFSAAKCFPRKYDPFANSVLFVGNISETIPTTDIVLS